MNVAHILVGIAAAVIYAFLGYSASGQPFNWRKFLRTVAIAALATLGLDVSGLTVDIYTAVVGPTAITVWLQKLIDTAATAKAEAKSP